MTTQGKVIGMVAVVVIAAAILLAVNWGSMGAPKQVQDTNTTSQTSQAQVAMAPAESPLRPVTVTGEGATGANNAPMDAAGQTTAGSNSTTTTREVTAQAKATVMAPITVATLVTDGPLQMTLPEGWTVSPPNSSVNFYTVTLSLDPLARFGLGPMGASSPGDTPQTIMDKAAQQVAQNRQTNSQNGGLDSTISQGAIEGTAFSGNYLTIRSPDGSVRTDFVLSDGQILWNGKYYGPESDWEKVKAVLSTMKKN